MDPTSTMHQWLTLKDLQRGVKHHNAAQVFTDFRKELEMLAKAIRNQEPNAGSRVEMMSGGEVLGTVLIKWLKDGGGGHLCSAGSSASCVATGV